MPEVAPIIKIFISQSYNEELTFDVTNVPSAKKISLNTLFPPYIISKCRGHGYPYEYKKRSHRKMTYGATLL